MAMELGAYEGGYDTGSVLFAIGFFLLVVFMIVIRWPKAK